MQRYVRLPARGFIEVSGPDRSDFLQGLITQDVVKLSPQTPLLYSALLTPNGKYLFDFFLWFEPESILMETDVQRRDELYSLLKRYVLRKHVALQAADGEAYQIFGEGGFDGPKDPRHEALGWRSRVKPDVPEGSLEEWNTLRLQHNVPEAHRDLRIGLSTPFEGNIDLLNGIAFDKGCYMGQELVSRIHHRGLVKKRFPNL